VDPYWFPPFHGNWLAFSELLRNPLKGDQTSGIKKSRTFPKGAWPSGPL